MLLFVLNDKINYMNNVKDILPQNLTKLRNKKKWTQGELAAKLNYTDKSVSKWEHGDAIPPIDVLKDIADLYGVTVDYLISEHEEGSYDKIFNDKKNKPSKLIITMLAVSLVWISATIWFVYAKIFSDIIFWKVFVFAVPLSTIVLIVFNGIWGNRKNTFILVSVLIWSVIASIYLFFLPNYNLWPVFVLGAPLQIATWLWSNLKRN